MMNSVESILNNLGSTMNNNNNNTTVANHDNNNNNNPFIGDGNNILTTTTTQAQQQNVIQSLASEQQQQQKHFAFFPNSSAASSSIPFHQQQQSVGCVDSVHGTMESHMTLGNNNNNRHSLNNNLTQNNLMSMFDDSDELHQMTDDATHHHINNNTISNSTNATIDHNFVGNAMLHTTGSGLDTPRAGGSDAGLDGASNSITNTAHINSGSGPLPDGIHPISNLYVTNLAMGVDNDLLFQWFRPFGPLISACVMVDVQTGRSRGYGFVQYENEADGENALKNLNGRVMPVPRDNQTLILRVQRSVHKKVSQPAPTTCVFVRNIPSHYNSANLLPLMKQYGDVERIQLYSITDTPSLLKACVEFKKREGALAAVNALHRKLLDPSCEVALAARFADNRKPSSSSSGNNNNNNNNNNSNASAGGSGVNLSGALQESPMIPNSSRNPGVNFDRNNNINNNNVHQDQQQHQQQQKRQQQPQQHQHQQQAQFQVPFTANDIPFQQQQQGQHFQQQQVQQQRQQFAAVEVDQQGVVNNNNYHTNNLVGGISKERLAQCQIVTVDGKFYRLVPIEDDQDIIRAQIIQQQQQHQQVQQQQQQLNLQQQQVNLQQNQIAFNNNNNNNNLNNGNRFNNNINNNNAVSQMNFGLPHHNNNGNMTQIPQQHQQQQNFIVIPQQQQQQQQMHHQQFQQQQQGMFGLPQQRQQQNGFAGRTF